MLISSYDGGTWLRHWLLKNLSCVNPKILVKTSLSVVEKSHFVLWDIYCVALLLLLFSKSAEFVL